MIVLDTHVLVWLIEGDDRLGLKSRDIIEDERCRKGVHVSAITSWEISMLIDKGRLALSRALPSWIAFAFAVPGIQLAPIEPMIGVDAGTLPGDIHGDPADRLIAATARAFACPLMTADGPLSRYADQGHIRIIDARH